MRGGRRAAWRERKRGRERERDGTLGSLPTPHPVKLRVYINKNTLLNINNVILHDLTAVILTASPGP